LLRNYDVNLQESYHNSRVEKRFALRAKLKTAWSLEGWIQCEVNKRQALVQWFSTFSEWWPPWLWL